MSIPVCYIEIFQKAERHYEEFPLLLERLQHIEQRLAARSTLPTDRSPHVVTDDRRTASIR
jgi:hypothetical protein